MADSTILVKGEGWKVKAALGLGGLTTLIILAFMYRIEIGVITLAIGLTYTIRLGLSAFHYHRLAGFERRKTEAETAKLEYEALQAKARSYFIETNTGVFVLDGITISQFYPALRVSQPFADASLLLPAPGPNGPNQPPVKRLLDIKYEHILIVGPTRSGKTTVANHLIDAAEYDATIYALDPHATQNRLKGLSWSPRAQVVGDGRDWAAIDAMLVSLLAEMNDRFRRSTIPQPVYVANDEWLAVLKNCPHAKGFFETFGSEAAKVNMHLIIATQAATVDDLGCSADVRDNLVELRLSHASKAENRGQLRWGRGRDTVELVELPGVYRGAFTPARAIISASQSPLGTEPMPVQEPVEPEPLPVLDAGPVAPIPTADELKICEAWDRGIRSLRSIHAEISEAVFGGKQANGIKDVLRRFGRIE